MHIVIELLQNNIIIGIIIFSICSIIIPISILTVFYATIYNLYYGLFVIACSYLLSIVLVYKFFSKIIRKFIKINNKTIIEFSQKNISLLSIIIGAMSIPFIPLILILDILKIDFKKILIGVYLGGIPMISLIYITANTGKEYINVDTIRYFSLLIVFFYVIYKIIKISIKYNKRKI